MRGMGTMPVRPGTGGAPGAPGISVEFMAISPGFSTTLAVRKIISSKRVASVASFLKSQPSTRMFLIHGNPSCFLVPLSSRRPLMTMVPPSGIRTCVIVCRVPMTGAVRPAALIVLSRVSRFTAIVSDRRPSSAATRGTTCRRVVMSE